MKTVIKLCRYGHFAPEVTKGCSDEKVAELLEAEDFTYEEGEPSDCGTVRHYSGEEVDMVVISR